MSQWTSSFSLIGPTGPAGSYAGNYYGDILYYSSGTFVATVSSIKAGAGSGELTQEDYSVAIGVDAGHDGQDAFSVAIGNGAGFVNQSTFSVAIGHFAGASNQYSNATAIGASAGTIFQMNDSVAIGNFAGYLNQSAFATAIGSHAGDNTQGSGAVAIGFQAGSNAQGANAIAIGNQAGNDSQSSNSIVLNASTGPLTAPTIGLYINPIREVEPNHQHGLFYDTATKEVIYNSIITISSLSTLIVGGNIAPNVSLAYTLGTSSLRYKDVFVGPGSINIAGPSNASATIGTDAQGIIYTEGGFATPYLNIGPSQLTPQAIGGWQIGPTGTQGAPGYDLVAQELQTNGSGPTGPSYSVINGLGNQYASFISETTQSTISVSTVAITYDERTTVNGILNIENNSYPGSKIIIPVTGTYKFMFSAQINHTGGGSDYIAIWPGINGAFVGKSTTRVRLPSNVETCLTVEYILECEADDYVEFFMAADTTSILLKYFPEESAISGVTIPSVPSIIVTVMRIF